MCMDSAAHASSESFKAYQGQRQQDSAAQDRALAASLPDWWSSGHQGQPWPALALALPLAIAVAATLECCR